MNSQKNPLKKRENSEIFGGEIFRRIHAQISRESEKFLQKPLKFFENESNPANL